MPRLSVVLPFLVQNEAFDAALDSVLTQSFGDFELIAVQNAPGPLRLPDDRRIRHLYQPIPGIVPALQMGIEQVSSPLIARMDADDIALPTRLEKQYDYLSTHPHVDLVACRVLFESTVPRHQGYLRYCLRTNGWLSEEQIRLKRFVESPIAHPTVMYRKSAVEKYGTYRAGHFAEDYELWLRWMEAGAILHKLPEALLLWNDHEERLSRTNAACSPEAFYAIKTAYLARYIKNEVNNRLPVCVWGAGKLSRPRAMLLQEHGINIHKFYDINPKLIASGAAIDYRLIPPPGSEFILSYVGNAGAGEAIESFLKNKGYREGVDFLCVA